MRRRRRIDGVVHPSVTNIGVRPTVDASGRTTVETHIFNFDRDLYGTPIRVGFVQRLRDERAFESLDLLKAQIAADCAARARAVRSAFTVESRDVPDQEFFFALELSEPRRSTACSPSWPRACSSTSAASAGGRRADRPARRGADERRRQRRAPVRRAVHARAGALEIVVAAAGRAGLADATWPLPTVADRMRLYNTLTRSEETFAPGAGNTVRMYTCGLTVYARGHIGNFRTFVCVDVLRRTLRYLLGYEMRQVMNFTDVDDRTIAGAQKAGMDLRDVHRPVHRRVPRGRARARARRRSRRTRARPTRRTCARWPI